MHWNDFYMLASLIELIPPATNDFMHVYPTFTGSSPVWSMSMRCFVIAPVHCVAFANVPIVSKARQQTNNIHAQFETVDIFCRTRCMHQTLRYIMVACMDME